MIENRLFCFRVYRNLLSSQIIQKNNIKERKIRACINNQQKITLQSKVEISRRTKLSPARKKKRKMLRCGHMGTRLMSERKNCKPFCECSFPSGLTLRSQRGYISDLVKCRCGEEDQINGPEWKWEKIDANAIITDREVTFHPIFSQGTVVVRGNKSLEANMVHYFEIRILTVLVGTDFMIGIGTDKVNLAQHLYSFHSAIGLDAESWGYSYHGAKQHNSILEQYGSKYSQGSIVGVYVDRSLGILEFYVNRRKQGIAFTNIPKDPNVQIYPMICSTAAKTVTRLVSASSQKDCLQLRAFKTLVEKNPYALRVVQTMPGLRFMMQQYWFLTLRSRYAARADNGLTLADLAVMSKQSRRKKKYQDENAQSNDDDEDDIIIYRFCHKKEKDSNMDNEEPDFIKKTIREYFARN